METNTANQKKVVYVLSYTTQENTSYIHGILEIYANKQSAICAMNRTAAALKDLGFTFTPCKDSARIIMTRKLDGRITNMYVEPKTLL